MEVQSRWDPIWLEKWEDQCLVPRKDFSNLMHCKMIIQLAKIHLFSWYFAKIQSANLGNTCLCANLQTFQWIVVRGTRHSFFLLIQNLAWSSGESANRFLPIKALLFLIVGLKDWNCLQRQNWIKLQHVCVWGVYDW